MMVFADGENLVLRFQEMVRRGFVPQDNVAHERDTFVWSYGFTQLGGQHEIIRATYYTYATGDAARVTSVKTQLQEQTFNKHMASPLPNHLTARVFKKEARSRSGKGVDIQLCAPVNPVLLVLIFASAFYALK